MQLEFTFWLLFFLSFMLVVRSLKKLPFSGRFLSRHRQRSPAVFSTVPPYSNIQNNEAFQSHLSNLQFEHCPNIALSLQHHVKLCIETTLRERAEAECDPQIINQTIHSSTSLFNQLITNPKYTASNKEFVTVGDSICNAIRRVSEPVLSDLFDGRIEIEEILEYYQNDVEKNKLVFDTISSHHKAITKQDWAGVVSSTEALSKYASAAAAMGAKKWVIEGNLWMEKFAVSYFRLGGARKHYLKTEYNINDMKFSSAEVKRAWVDKYAKDLMISNQATTIGSTPSSLSESLYSYNSNARKIRLLDVGSCYNPIEKSDKNRLFEVTALDLCPTDPSVFQCDFLNLTIGETNTIPIINSLNSTENNEGRKKEIKETEKNILLQLPAHSYDAITMSLVLSYLPTPEQRIEMIRKARKLLITSNHKNPDVSTGSGSPTEKNPEVQSNPHHSGLLLITEKPSIFHMEQTSDTIGKNKSFYLSSWKQAIINEGFELVKHQILRNKGHESHVFAFAAINKPILPCEDKTLMDAKMWIRSDFTPISSNSEFHSDDEEGQYSKSTSISDDSVLSNTPSNHSEDIICTTGQTHNRPIAIVGGGIGGCALALSLQQKKIPYLIFEKDLTFDIRKQGYALTMQQGGAALRALGLGSLLNTYGTLSENHTSYRWDGIQLGAYGLTKRQPYSSSADNNLVEENNHNTIKKTSNKSLLSAKTRHNVHIPRQKLREIMMQNVDKANILWNKKLKSMKIMTNNSDSNDDSQTELSSNNNSSSSSSSSSSTSQYVRLAFEDGSECDVAAVVGADGIFSTVRTELQTLMHSCSTSSKEVPPHTQTAVVGSDIPDISVSDATSTDPLQYLGLMVILGISPNPSTGTVRKQSQWLDGQTRVFSMPYDQHHTMWQLSYPCEESTALQISTSPPTGTSTPVGNALKEEALQRCKGWAPDLVSMLEAAHPNLVSGHPVYDRDPDDLDPVKRLAAIPTNCDAGDNNATCTPLNWPITLLGDAAHPMSPFKGQGANQAILDALLLSRAISSSNLYASTKTSIAGKLSSYRNRRNISENLRLYESEMYMKGSEKVKRSRDAAHYLHHESALAEANVTRAKAAQDFSISQQNLYIKE